MRPSVSSELTIKCPRVSLLGLGLQPHQDLPLIPSTLMSGGHLRNSHFHELCLTMNVCGVKFAGNVQLFPSYDDPQGNPPEPSLQLLML